jgi:hypothetical protein
MLQCKCKYIKQVRKHLYFSPSVIPVVQIRENKMSGTCGKFWEEEKCIHGICGTTVMDGAAKKT